MRHGQEAADRARERATAGQVPRMGRSFIDSTVSRPLESPVVELLIIDGRLHLSLSVWNSGEAERLQWWWGAAKAHRAQHGTHGTHGDHMLLSLSIETDECEHRLVSTQEMNGSRAAMCYRMRRCQVDSCGARGQIRRQSMLRMEPRAQGHVLPPDLAMPVHPSGPRCMSPESTMGLLYEPAGLSTV